jgi:Fic family protein
VKAFVPALLAERSLDLDAATQARTATAIAEVAHGAAALPEDYAPLARLLLRSEGDASSFIEGVAAPVVDVVLAEHRGGSGAASWVAANLAAATDAIAAADRRLSPSRLCGWHRTLMAGSPTPGRYVGRLRDEQGWIGGPSPLDAHLVTPPPDRLKPLIADLVSYANRTDVDPVAQAAVAHAQFEVIHPFADGNGRVGRILVAWLLTRRLHLLTPPPVSTAIAADVGGYAAGLTQFRLGAHGPWIRWFADAVAGASRSQEALVDEVAALQIRWRTALEQYGGGRSLRSDASAWAVLELLPQHLVLTAQVVADELGQTPKAALDALRTLAEAGVLKAYGTAPSVGRGRPAALFVSAELLALAGATPLR